MKPVLYRPASKAPLAAAFALAAAIHVSALAFAPAREPVAATTGNDIQDVDGIDSRPQDSVPELPPLVETLIQPPTEESDDFVDTPESSPQVRPNPTRPIKANRNASPPAAARGGKLFAISKPRPAYPYEARLRHMTGSGVALLNVDSTTGSVLTATIVQSTGSPILDNSALSAFRRWRFRLGGPASVRIPFTFTMFGVQL